MKKQKQRRAMDRPRGAAAEPLVETTVFRSGNSDAVRLPKRLGLRGARVVVRAVGEGRFLIEPKRKPRWPSGFLESFGRVSDDFEAPPRSGHDPRDEAAAARRFDEE